MYLYFDDAGKCKYCSAKDAVPLNDSTISNGGWFTCPMLRDHHHHHSSSLSMYLGPPPSPPGVGASMAYPLAAGVGASNLELPNGAVFDPVADGVGAWLS